MDMLASMTNGLAVSALVLSTVVALPSTAFAGEVTLKSADGTVNMTGEFIEFANNTYLIGTALGDLRVSAARVSCEGADCPSLGLTEADVKISGSETIGLGVMPLLLSGYASFLGAEATETATDGTGEFFAELVGDDGFGDPIGSYLVNSSSSSNAFDALLASTAEIGMSARRILPIEARALRDAGAGNMISPSQEHIIAIDSLVIIVHPENPIDTLTMEQLRGIYSGTITNWSEVGGAGAPIAIVDRAEDSGTRDVFKERVFGEEAPAILAGADIVANSNEVASTVNNDPNAIGFVGYAFQRGAKPLTLVNACGLGMIPDAFSARTEEYALHRFLYLYNREDTTNDSAAQFVNFTISEYADEVIRKAGFIDLGVDRQEQPLDGGRAKQLFDPNVDDYEGGVMRSMLSQMAEYDRLSTTFRFRTGSSNLDPRGRLNLVRLADYLQGQPVGTKVLFVGFTDDIGPFEANQALSFGRAEQIIAEMKNFTGDRLEGIEMAAAGYGEVAPSACNLSDTGRAINRRVEVWIQ